MKNDCLNGIYSEFANALGMDAAIKIHALFRGQQVFIRSQIIAEYDGSNIKQLATKYGYTEKRANDQRSLKKILKEHIDNSVTE